MRVFLCAICLIFSSSFSLASDAYKEGVYEYNHGNYKVAFNFLLPEAKNGNHNAQFRIAYLLINGLGVNKDVDQGLFWIRKSAEDGYYISQYYLGERYFEGDIINKDIVEAYAWTKISLKNVSDNSMHHQLNVIEKEMTETQLSKGKSLAEKYKAKYSKQ